MNRDGPRKVGDFLGSGELARIAGEAKNRRELVALVRAELPPAEADHVVSAYVNDADQLVIGVDSSAWAARLRYSRDELLGRQLKVRVTAPGTASTG